MTKTMSKCHKCGKPVYFAERKTSLGHDWHPKCLRCVECGKVLSPGQHAEHRGVPYCHIPCYSALFGPRLVGHGSPVGAHTSFGNPEFRPALSISRDVLLSKLKVYNHYFENKSGQLDSRELNGRLILEGSLKIYWGMSKPIKFVEDDGIPVPQKRHSYLLDNDDDDEDEDIHNTSANTSKNILSEQTQSQTPASDNQQNVLPSENVDISTYEVRYRKHTGSSHQVKLKRRCSINGHFYNKETSIFTPAYGSMTTVRITSLVSTQEVIHLLLRKFKVTNNPEEFGLFVVRDNGERRQIKDIECPLQVRVMLGPFEDIAQIFIMDKESAPEISSEVAQYILFSNVELQAILQKFYEEEEREVQKLRREFYRDKKALQWRLLELQPSEEL